MRSSRQHESETAATKRQEFIGSRGEMLANHLELSLKR
jgi:hypothetical protein